MIIDRFEGEFAVVELSDKTFINIPLSELPKSSKEGDVLIIGIDQKETEKRKERIKDLMDDLWS
ncbi:DUF3006 domain-containing protein [Acetobacterium bakii]|uniref:Uncharacterized protein n=1 Tax=Acetobacterium bakii TaxID=52689 RepID=A0A0L6TWF2_9FIRM|nr:DUF3006 domain-containing protein [Acetobacterium bakii]KNZ40606.1 hypothetical protein AKG39_16810 [Acetobacterium bakii]